MQKVIPDVVGGGRKEFKAGPQSRCLATELPVPAAWHSGKLRAVVEILLCPSHHA